MIYTILYIVMISFSSILRNIIGTNAPLVSILFFSTFFALVFFHLMNIQKNKIIYKKVFKQTKLYLLNSSSIAIVWFGSFVIPIYFSPTIQVFTFMLFTSLLGSIFMKKETIGYNYKNIKYMLSVILVIFYIKSFFIYSSLQFISLLFLTSLTGIFGYIYFLSSTKLNQQNFSSIEILAVRFWPLFILSLISFLYQHQFLIVNIKLVFDSFFISLTSLILPVFFAQKSIEIIGHNRHAIFIGIAPCITFFLEKIFLKTEGNFFIYLSIALFLVILLPFIINGSKYALNISK